MTRKRNLTSEEERLWRQAMKDIEPLQDSTPFDLGDEVSASGSGKKGLHGGKRNWESPSPKRFARVTPPVIRHPANPEPKRNPTAPASLDDLNRQEKQRVKRGKVEVDGKIDLHGLRQSEAHHLLIERIIDARSHGKRILLVVTGKGASKGRSKDSAEPFWARGGGVLKQQVPVWLREEPLRSMIFSVQEAHQRHGGGGALYVFLKKVR